MPNDIPYDQLEAYLRNNLDETERAAFEQRLETDPDLRAELELYRQIREANRDERLDALEAKMQAAASAYQEAKDQPHRGKIRPLWLWAAAAILIAALLFFGGRQFFLPAPADPAQLYAEYAQREFSFQEMSDGSELSEIEALLESDQYAAALPRLNVYLFENPDAPDVLLAKGIALLETGQSSQAIATFTDLGEQYSLYRTEARWQIALAHLKEGRITESLASLRQLPEEASRYPEAQQLMKVLEKIQE